VLRRIDGLHAATAPSGGPGAGLPVGFFPDGLLPGGAGASGIDARPADWTGLAPGAGPSTLGAPAADDGASGNGSPGRASRARARTAAPISGAEYARLVTRIRALVRTVVPGDAVVAVVSRGDDALIDLDGRLGWHFPRCDDGRYAGHYPKDSDAAVAHLEEQRRRGARYLLFPATSLWWLDYYDDLRQHLDRTYRLVVRRDDACAIYALDSQEVTR